MELIPENKKYCVNAGALCPRTYTESLLAEGLRCGLLTDDDILQIQTALIFLLAETTDRYTANQSTSIREETAQELLQSILYTVGIRLKAESSPEDAVQLLRKRPLKVLAAEGLAKIERRCSACRILLQKLKRHPIPVSNLYYRTVLCQDIPMFFRIYRPEFSAHLTHVSLDYPLYLYDFSEDGIEGIASYLQIFFYETAFCRYYTEDVLHRFLSAQHAEYPSAMCNLFAPVFAETLGLLSIGRSPQRLNMLPEEWERLSARCENRMDALTDILHASLDQLQTAMHVSNGAMQYYRRCITPLARNICGTQNR